LDQNLREELVNLMPRLRRFARGLTGCAEEADDLVQAACERALTRHHQWQPGTRLDSWLYRIIQTIRLDQLRAAATRNRHLDTIQAEHENRPLTDTHMETNLSLERVRNALQLLPEDQRSVIMLVSVEGYSYREAAELLEIPIGTVTSRLTRGRLALDRLLHGNECEPACAQGGGA